MSLVIILKSVLIVGNKNDTKTNISEHISYFRRLVFVMVPNMKS